MKFVLSAFLAAASAKMSFGSCPDVSNMESLDKSAYAGKWYEIQRDPMFPYTMGSTCTFKEYTLDSNGDLDLWFGAYQPMMFSYAGVGGKMYCDESMEETCEATMTDTGDYRAPFGVLATDYQSYDIAYFCMDMIEGVMKAEFVMIYGREPEMSEETLAEARGIINEMVPSYALDW